MRRAIAPALEGRLLEHVEISDDRLTRPEDRHEVAAELMGSGSRTSTAAAST